MMIFNAMNADSKGHRPTAGVVRARLDLARARMDLFVQEVCDEVNDRVSQNMEAARSDAQVLRELAKQFDELMEIPVVEIANAGGITLCKVICDLAEVTGPFERWFKKWDQEHGAVLEESVRETARRFIDWVEAQELQVAPIWDRHVAALDRDLRESRAEGAAFAADWSNADADGLT